MAQYFLIKALLIITLLLTFCQANPSLATRRILSDNYDDGSEMNQAIIRDYLASEECVRVCGSVSEQRLMDSF